MERPERECKNFCGEPVEYEPHKFSDGFVYYLPRNLDKTIHNCPFVLDMDDQDEFDDLIIQAVDDPESVYYEDIDAMEQQEICQDNLFLWSIMLDEIHQYDNNGISLTIEDLINTQNLISNWTGPFFMGNCHGVYENITPTNRGYQLEILGWKYQIIGKYDDAKKCYELQHEISEELELLGVIHKLNKKIDKLEKYFNLKNSIVGNVSQDEIEKIIKKTELKLRKFITTLYSGKFERVWDRLPKIKESILERQENAKSSMINVNEINELDNSTLGELIKILKMSNPKKRVDKDHCNICEKSWKNNSLVYYEKIQKEIFCKDKICFIKQGGLIKDIPWDFVTSLTRINNLRNMISHDKNYDKKQIQHEFNEIRFTCAKVNSHMDDLLNIFNNV